MTLPVTHDSTLLAAALAALLPLCAFGLIMIATRRSKRVSAALSIGAVTGSLGCALFLLIGHWQMDQAIEATGRWVVSGSLSIPFGVLLDPLSLLMLVIVTAISFLVQVYSLGYMAGDPGFSRYYAFMSLFAWAMISLTISPTMIQLYIFWELVGLSSYLLIGFWFEKVSASEAGKKAFVMTRLGDVAFLLGLLMVLVNFGNLDIRELNAGLIPAQMAPGLITLSALLIFGGIIGKSAQFPLLTWLPDAMEGPTPVSALLHSATMVAAGVYLFARLFPFFSLSPAAMTLFLAVGTVSMLLASTMAMVSRDIKQVWAYSTISQLGFMIMGLAAGGYVAGVFHLTTHAAFKALLFLCAGVLIHAFHTNDMFEIGRKGGRRLLVATVTMIIGAAALAGLPPASGYFSKELIMGRLAQLDNPVWLAAGLTGAFLTSYYTFRLIFIILRGDDAKMKGDPTVPHSPAETAAGDSRDPGRKAMGWPLAILAALTLGLGFFQKQLTHFLTQLSPAVPGHGGGHPSWLPYTAVGIALGGLLLAWLEFGRHGASQTGFVERAPGLKNLFARRWYLDHFYRWALERIVYAGFSALCTLSDNKVIDGGIDALSRTTKGGGRILSALHSGMVQYRLMVIFAVMILLALLYFF